MIFDSCVNYVHCVQVDEAVNALCSIVLESNIAHDSDDFTYRQRASYLLMRVSKNILVELSFKRLLCKFVQFALSRLAIRGR